MGGVDIRRIERDAGLGRVTCEGDHNLRFRWKVLHKGKKSEGKP